MKQKLESFLSLVSVEPHVLILGSMPSVQSLKTQQYYAHPRNHFWPLMGRILQSDVPEDYAVRCEWLCSHHIALWDSVYRCFRQGSQDVNIQEVEPNDIDAFLNKYPTIRAVFFNGVAAKKYFEKFHQLPDDVSSILLPSSSPIPRPNMITMDDKLPFWMEIQKELILSNKTNI